MRTEPTGSKACGAGPDPYLLIGIFRVGRVNCPCPEQGRNPKSQLSSAIFAPILPTEHENHDQSIHSIPVNGLILRFYGWN